MFVFLSDLIRNDSVKSKDATPCHPDGCMMPSGRDIHSIFFGKLKGEGFGRSAEQYLDLKEHQVIFLLT